VLAAESGRALDTSTPPREVWVIDGRPPCGPGIKTAQEAAKAASRPESEWMTFASAAVRQAEQRFKDAVATATVSAEWERENPRPAHETRGGPLADRAQLSIPYLEGLSLNQAKDKVLSLVFGFTAIAPRTRIIDDNVDDHDDDDT